MDRNRHLVGGPGHERSAVLSDRRASEDADEDGHANNKPDEVPSGGFLSEQPARRAFESAFARVVATTGIVGVGTALGAILIAANVAGWIVGFAVSIVTVALAAMLWRSRRL